MDTTYQSRTAINSVGLFLGIDVGTSGIRTCVIDSNKQIVNFYSLPFTPSQAYQAKHWWHITQQLLLRLKNKQLAARIKAISIDGTSGTLLALNKELKVLGDAIMYFENPSISSTPYLNQQPQINAYLKQYPTLKKALALKSQFNQAIYHYMHQADWIAFKISQTHQFSDYHNCLKLGFDAQTKQWHPSVQQLLGSQTLPQVKSPGEAICTLKVAKLALNNCLMSAGTTDSNAAFIASGITQFGQALTNLGSTLVLKIFSPCKVESKKHGVYSHKYKNGWIVSGASNCGAGILKQYFSDDEIAYYSAQLQPSKPTQLNYYPLSKKGERFPIADENKLPNITPIPKNKAIFFQALLESLAHIEHQGYLLLHQLGAPKVSHIVSAGGGAKNLKWQQIRQNINQVSISQAKNDQAAFGASLLALASYNAHNLNK